MEDDAFYDLLYQHWSKTSWAQESYWMPEEDESFPGSWNLFAVNEKQERKPLAAFMDEADADFITAVHGCIPDLIRKLRESEDRAERFECACDEQEGRIADLELEILELKGLARTWGAPV